MGRVPVVLVGALLALGSVTSLALTGQVPHTHAVQRHKLSPEVLEERAEVTRRMLPLLVQLAVENSKQQMQHKAQRDLEMFLDLEFDKKFTKILFDLVEPTTRDLVHHDKDQQLETDEAVPRLAIPQVYSLMSLYENLPPIREIGEALERWHIFTGSQNKQELTPHMLKEAYKQVFTANLTDNEANRMISSLAVNRAEKTSQKISRCEFILGTLRQDYVDDRLLEGISELWQKHEFWTMKDILFELGYQEEDSLGFEMLDRLIFSLDSERSHPAPPASTKKKHKDLEQKTTHYYSYCEFTLAISVMRNNMFRGFLQTTTPMSLEQSESNKYEVFMGKAVFPHSADQFAQAREKKSELLLNLFHSCDDDGDEHFDLKDFTAFLHTMDMWQELVPRFTELVKDDKIESVQSFDSRELSDPVIVMDPHVKEIFEKTWAALAGQKTFTISSKLWAESTQKAFARAHGKPEHEADIADLGRHHIHKYPVLGALHGLYKPEVLNAWYGHPVASHAISSDEIQNTLDLIVATPKTPDCDRNTWILLSAVVRGFTALDKNKDGALSLPEFLGIGIYTMKRLRNNVGKYTALSSKDEAEHLYNEFVKKTGEKMCTLSCFASMFKTGSKVTLASLIDPPELKHSYIKQKEDSRPESK